MPTVSIPKCACGHSDTAHSLAPSCAFCTCPGFQLDHAAQERIAPRPWRVTNSKPGVLY